MKKARFQSTTLSQLNEIRNSITRLIPVPASLESTTLNHTADLLAELHFAQRERDNAVGYQKHMAVQHEQKVKVLEQTIALGHAARKQLAKILFSKYATMETALNGVIDNYKEENEALRAQLIRARACKVKK